MGYLAGQTITFISFISIAAASRALPSSIAGFVHIFGL